MTKRQHLDDYKHKDIERNHGDGFLIRSSCDQGVLKKTLAPLWTATKTQPESSKKEATLSARIIQTNRWLQQVIQAQDIR